MFGFGGQSLSGQSFADAMKLITLLQFVVLCPSWGTVNIGKLHGGYAAAQPQSSPPDSVRGFSLEYTLITVEPPDCGLPLAYPVRVQYRTLFQSDVLSSTDVNAGEWMDALSAPILKDG